MNPTKPCLWKQAPVTETESDSAFEKTHWILPASAVWFINFNLTSHELSLDRGRERRLDSLPLPPNRTGGFSASRSPVRGSTPIRVTPTRMSLFNREQTLLRQLSLCAAL